MIANSRLDIVAALLPAAVILTLFVAIMSGATWASALVAAVSVAVLLGMAALAYLVHLAGLVGIVGGAARLVTHRDLVVKYVDEGDVADAARHEGGHASAIGQNGGRVSAARVFPDGSGYVSGSLPGGDKRTQAVRQVAVSLAGGLREGVNPWTDAGCRSDMKIAKDALRWVSSGERDAVLAEATTLAHATKDGSFARTVERRLLATGRY